MKKLFLTFVILFLFAILTPKNTFAQTCTGENTLAPGTCHVTLLCPTGTKPDGMDICPYNSSIGQREFCCVDVNAPVVTPTPPPGGPDYCPGSQVCQRHYSQTECSNINGNYGPCLTSGGQEGTCCWDPPIDAPAGCCYDGGTCPNTNETCQVSGSYLCSRRGYNTCVTAPGGGGVTGIIQTPSFNLCSMTTDSDALGRCNSCHDPTSPNPGIWTGLGCIHTGNPEELIGALITLAVGVAGGLAFLLMIYGAFVLTTSAGNPENIQKGRDIMGGAVAGLFFIIFAVVLLQLIGVKILDIPGF